MGSEQAYRDGEAQGSDRATTPGGEGTEVEVESLRGLLSLATPGEWYVWQNGDERTVQLYSRTHGSITPMMPATRQTIGDLHAAAVGVNSLRGNLLATVDALTKRAEAAEGDAAVLRRAADELVRAMFGGVPDPYWSKVYREWSQARDARDYGIRSKLGRIMFPLAARAAAEKGQVQP